MRVEKLPWLHVTMSYLRFGLESERNCFQEHLHPVGIMEITVVLLFSCPVMSDSFQLHGLWHMCLSVHGIQYLGHEYWNGLPFPSPGILPHPGIEPGYPALAGRFFTAMPQGKLKVKVSQENYS